MPKLLLGNADHKKKNSSIRNIVLNSVFENSNFEHSVVQFIPIISQSRKSNFRELLTRGTSQGCSEKQSVGSSEIYPSLKLFKENVFEKLHEMQLLKLTHGTNLLGDIPTNLKFDVESASANPCGVKRIKEADKLSGNRRGNYNERLVCSFHQNEEHERKHSLHLEGYGSAVINLFPVLRESTKLTISHKKITYICSNEEQSYMNSAKELKLLKFETESNSTPEQSVRRTEFSTCKIWENIELQHENTITTSSESVSITKWLKPLSRSITVCQESLINLNNILKVSSKEPESSFLVYSIFNQPAGIQNSAKSISEAEDNEFKRRTNKEKCKCKGHKSPCTCCPRKDKSKPSKRLKTLAGGTTCGCVYLDKIISSDKTMVKRSHHLKDTSASSCDEITLATHEFPNNCTVMTVPSPMKLDMMLKKDKQKYSNIKCEDVVAKLHKQKYENSKIPKAKKKCGCMRPYQTNDLLPTSAPSRPAQKRRFSNSCKTTAPFSFLVAESGECGKKLNVKQPVCKMNARNRKDMHLCDICKLFYGIGDIMDNKKSQISIEFSDVEKLISVLDDIKNTGSKISIKRLRDKTRNTDTRDFNEDLLTCHTERTKRPKTIGIKIEYSDYEQNVLECARESTTGRMGRSENEFDTEKTDSCSCLDRNSQKAVTKFECIFRNDCPCAASSIYESVTFNKPECAWKYQETSKYKEKGIDLEKCRATDGFPADADAKDEVKCIFKSKRTCSYSDKSETTSAAHIKCRTAMDDQDKQKSCFKGSCPKLLEPVVVPEQCLVEGSCIREKLLRTICLLPEKTKDESENTQKRTSVKTEKKKTSKAPTTKTDSPKKTPSKKKNSKKDSPDTPTKPPPKQKNPKKGPSAKGAKKTSSKQKTSASDTKVAARKTNSKQKTTASDTKVSARKTNSKQKTSASDTKVPARKTNSKQKKSTSDTKVTAKKTKPKQTKSASDTKAPARKTNSKEASSVNATKTSAGKKKSKKATTEGAAKKTIPKSKSKDKAASPDKETSSNSRPATAPSRQPKIRKEPPIVKEVPPPPPPVLILNELDQSMLSQAIDAYLRKKGFF